MPERFEDHDRFRCLPDLRVLVSSEGNIISSKEDEAFGSKLVTRETEKSCGVPWIIAGKRTLGCALASKVVVPFVPANVETGSPGRWSNLDRFSVGPLDDQEILGWPQKYRPVFGEVFAAMTHSKNLRQASGRPRRN
jgi:hypothetical protein